MKVPCAVFLRSESGDTYLHLLHVENAEDCYQQVLDLFDFDDDYLCDYMVQTNDYFLDKSIEKLIKKHVI